MFELILFFAALVVFAVVLPTRIKSKERSRDLIDQPRRKIYTPDVSRLKMAGDGATGDPGSFSGYGSVFGNKDSDGEIMAQGAYSETLASFIASGFIGVGHDWKSGVATITDAKEDAYGLYMEAQFHSDPESQTQRTRVMERMSRGKSVGLSVGFRIRGYEWDETETVLTITKADLYETSIVTVPANAAAGIISAKSGLPMFDKPETIREFEELLRDAGFSRKEAVLLASKGWNGFVSEPQRDSDDALSAEQKAAEAAFLSTLGKVTTSLLTVR